MELGKAYIAAGVGMIVTTRPPSPVYFAPSSFPGIVNNEDVYFERLPFDSRRAAQIMSAYLRNPLGGSYPVRR